METSQSVCAFLNHQQRICIRGIVPYLLKGRSPFLQPSNFPLPTIPFTSCSYPLRSPSIHDSMFLLFTVSFKLFCHLALAFLLYNFSFTHTLPFLLAFIISQMIIYKVLYTVHKNSIRKLACCLNSPIALQQPTESVMPDITGSIDCCTIPK